MSSLKKITNIRGQSDLCTEDVNLLAAKTAAENSFMQKTVVDEDTDVLVFLVHYCELSDEIFIT